jgi:hypothetical protein
MPDPPRLSGRDIFDWLQAFGFLILVVQVLRSSDPLSFKLAVIGIPLAYLYTTMVLRIGGRRERERIEDHLKRKRRESAASGDGAGRRRRQFEDAA